MQVPEHDWRRAERETADSPSPEFIRAVAQLLETDPDDLLDELGYRYRHESEMAAGKP